MEIEDKKYFARIWRDAYRTYQREASLEEIALAFSDLRRFSTDEIARALTLHKNDPERGVYTPKPADIVRIIEGTTKARSQEAWSKVDRAVRHIGPYRDVIFDDPLIHAVIDAMGGWIRLSSMDDREWKFAQHDFVSRYAAIASSRRMPAYPPILPGIANANNRASHRAEEGAMLVGDPMLARRVLTEGQQQPSRQYHLVGPQEMRSIQNLLSDCVSHES